MTQLRNLADRVVKQVGNWYPKKEEQQRDGQVKDVNAEKRNKVIKYLTAPDNETPPGRLTIDEQAMRRVETLLDKIDDGDPRNPWKDLTPRQVEAQVMGVVEWWESWEKEKERKTTQGLTLVPWYEGLGDKRGEVERTISSMLSIKNASPRAKRRPDDENEKKIKESNPWNTVFTYELGW